MSLDNDTLSLIRGFAEPLPPIVPGLRINVPQNRSHYHARVIPHSERHCTNCHACEECWRNTGNPNNPINPLMNFSLRNEWEVLDVIPYMKSVAAGICGNFINCNLGIEEDNQSEWEA